MIYITYRNSTFDDGSIVNNIWELSSDDVEESYKLFMAQKAEESGIVHNPHWLNIMNRENYHPDLTQEEYKQKEKAWNKVLKQWRIDRYIEEVLKGRKLEYKQIHRFR